MHDDTCPLCGHRSIKAQQLDSHYTPHSVLTERDLEDILGDSCLESTQDSQESEREESAYEYGSAK